MHTRGFLFTEHGSFGGIHKLNGPTGTSCDYVDESFDNYQTIWRCYETVMSYTGKMSCAHTGEHARLADTCRSLKEQASPMDRLR